MTHTQRASDSRGFTLVELLMVVAVVGVLAAIASPGLLRSRVSANEASALASVRAITTAQADFFSVSRGYADDLATLSGVCPGMTLSFIGADLSSNGITKSGYTFEIASGLGAVPAPNDCFGNPTVTTYYASATPLTVGLTGNRGFATNTAATIWQDTSGGVPTEPLTIAGTVKPIGR